MKNANKTLVDDKNYWKDRHDESSSLKASGVKSVSVKSNQYIYKILAEQYKKLLDDIDQKSIKTVLDAGFGDGYFLNFLSKQLSNSEIFGIDISPDARKKITGINRKNLFVGDLSTMKTTKTYDLVHCFDVLYHILGEEDYIASIKNLANSSGRYLILHERFFLKTPLLTSKHVHFRTAEYTNQLINGCGFYLEREIPTHFFAMRLLTYRLNSIFPKALYTLDNKIATKHPTTQLRLASHKIRLYTRKHL